MQDLAGRAQARRLPGHGEGAHGVAETAAQGVIENAGPVMSTAAHVVLERAAALFAVERGLIAFGEVLRIGLGVAGAAR